VGRFLSGRPGKVKEIAPLDLKLPGPEIAVELLQGWHCSLVAIAALSP
jgi:hypothetical protein